MDTDGTPLDGEPNSTLVWVQHGDHRPPVYCFHPLGGSAASYGPLALRLGQDQPVRGVQAVGLRPGITPDRTVAEMARRYATAIAAEPPAGAPVFVGYSMGGVLAVETARLLSDRLPQAPRIVTVDCDPLYTPTTSESGSWQILLTQVLDIDLPLGQLADLSTDDRLQLLRATGAAQGRIPIRFPLARLRAMLAVCGANEHAIAEHVPAPFPGTIHVLRPADSEPLPGGDMWDAFADQVMLSVLPGGHHDLLGSDSSRWIGELVRELLADTSRR